LENNIVVRRGSTRWIDSHGCEPLEISREAAEAEFVRMEIFFKYQKNELTDTGTRTHNYAVGCILLKSWD
jgi:hypothetical protein